MPYRGRRASSESSVIGRASGGDLRAESPIRGELSSSHRRREREGRGEIALSSPEILAPMGSLARHSAAKIRSADGSAQFSRKSSVRLISSVLSLSRSLPPLSAQLSRQNLAQILKSRELHAHLE
jgi:hypothetical protein